MTDKPKGRPPGIPNPKGGRKPSGKRKRTVYVTDEQYEKVQAFIQTLRASQK